MRLVKETMARALGAGQANPSLKLPLHMGLLGESRWSSVRSALPRYAETRKAFDPTISIRCCAQRVSQCDRKAPATGGPRSLTIAQHKPFVAVGAVKEVLALLDALGEEDTNDDS
jgi:hypothetical protein